MLSSNSRDNLKSQKQKRRKEGIRENKVKEALQLTTLIFKVNYKNK